MYKINGKKNSPVEHIQEIHLLCHSETTLLAEPKDRTGDESCGDQHKQRAVPSEY